MGWRRTIAYAAAAILLLAAGLAVVVGGGPPARIVVSLGPPAPAAARPQAAPAGPPAPAEPAMPSPPEPRTVLPEPVQPPAPPLPPGAAAPEPPDASSELVSAPPAPVAPAPAEPEPLPIAPPPALAPPLPVVTGFRSARFGMSAGEVAAAIAADFDRGDASVVTDGPAQRIAIEIDDLLPGIGPGRVVYRLGDRGLDRVTIAWSGSADQKLRLPAAALAANLLRTHFLAAGYDPATVQSDTESTEHDAVIVFQGEDAYRNRTTLTLRELQLGDSIREAGRAELELDYRAAAPMRAP